MYKFILNRLIHVKKDSNNATTVNYHYILINLKTTLTFVALEQSFAYYVKSI